MRYLFRLFNRRINTLSKRFLWIKNDPMKFKHPQNSNEDKLPPRARFWNNFRKFLKFMMKSATNLLILYVYFQIFRLLFQISGSNPMEFSLKKSQPKTDIPNTKFTDCIGIDEIAQEMSEMVDFIKNPVKYRELGGVSPKGVLLSGPPGTGKTLIAKALANEAGCHFIYRSGSDFDFKYVGEGAERVRKLFAEARENSPAIIFIDEIDSIGSKRGKSIGPVNQTINQLLTEMDGFQDKHDIIVIGATNLAERLDPALLRPGRFDKIITFSLPNELSRKKMIEYYLNKVKHNPQIDSTLFAKETMGMSGADINNIINVAAIKAVRDKKTEVEEFYLQKAITRVKLGTYGKKLDGQNMTNNSVYQSAKAVLALKRNSQELELIHATVLPINGSPGNCAVISRIDKMNTSKINLLNIIDFNIAGKVAEDVLFGKSEISQRSENDLFEATKIAKKVVKSFDKNFIGILSSEKIDSISDESLYKIESAVIELLKEREKIVRKFIEEHKSRILLVAEKMRQLETLKKSDIEKLMK